MGEAMLKALLAKGIVGPIDVAVGEVSGSRRGYLSGHYGVSVCEDNRQAITNAEMVVLAIKPQDLPAASAQMGNLSPEQLVVSILAGTPLATLHRELNHACLVRAMPNMPAQIGQGVTAWIASTDTSETQRETARTVLGALGEEVYVPDEKYIDMATALSGSGPAYVFLFVESLIDAGVYVGLPRHLSQRLVMRTLFGSAQMLEETGEHPAELRNAVTSPGGTTAEALLHLERGRLRSLFLEAVSAAYRKSASRS